MTYRHVYVEMIRPVEDKWALKCTYCGACPPWKLPNEWEEYPLCSRVVVWPGGRLVDHDWADPRERPYR